MELEALQGIHSEVRSLGAQIVVLTPELERYTRALHKKLNLSFDILTDLHLKTAEEFRLSSHYLITCATFTNPSAMRWTSFMMNWSTDCRSPQDTWSKSRGLSELPM